MFLRSPLHTWLIAFLAIAVLVARLGDAHLHLCFDGGEPTSSFHLLDSDEQVHESVAVVGIDSQHHDIDISLISQGLSKASQLSIDGVALLATLCLSVGWLTTRPVMPGALLTAVHVANPLSRRPPLRGPPR